MRSSRLLLTNESPAVSAPATRRPPRPVGWILLLGSALAVLLLGLFATALVLSSQLAPGPLPIRNGRIWAAFAAACGLTFASLGLRALRWVFLLRRSETRIPIRDAYVGYLAGFSLLLAPFLLGEIAVRASVLRQRGRVPAATTALVNVWERFFDVVALAAIMAAASLSAGQVGLATVAVIAAVAATMFTAVRAFLLRCASRIIAAVSRRAGHADSGGFGRLATPRTWIVGLAASVVAWVLPGLAFWALASSWDRPFQLDRAQLAYARATLAGGFALAPGGIVIAGEHLLAALGEAGLPTASAAWCVLGIRLATAGLSTVLGALFLLFHAASRPAAASHFDAIADAYDVQIPEARRKALLARKTDLMSELLAAHGIGGRGLDLGCGQGWYVARMRELGFDVHGIDESEGQIALAARNLGTPDLVSVGSALSIPAADQSYDFAYAINVLHHLPSVDDQRAAFAELMRVLRPGGTFFLHEINTRNVLFRFYMGYVFPSLNCIDEGVERWILPNRLASYTDVPVVGIRYFTFLPDFVPAPLVRLLAPLERWLERSPARLYSAHYMAAFRKPV